MDDELERIKERKLQELMRRTGSRITSQPVVAEPVVVTDATFDGFVRGHQLVVVDCWAAWCYPCRMVEPIVRELARDYAGRIIFGKLNVDENPATARRFAIVSIPTLLVIKNGDLVDRIVGALPKSQIESRLATFL